MRRFAIFGGIVVIIVAFLVTGAKETNAQGVGNISGRVFYRKGVNEIPLVGVKIHRVDWMSFDSWHQEGYTWAELGPLCSLTGLNDPRYRCPGIRHGVETTTFNNTYWGNGIYSMTNSPSGYTYPFGNVPQPVSGCTRNGFYLCPRGAVNNMYSPGAGQCDQTWYCAGLCGMLAHTWRAYFPSGYTFPDPSVPFRESDINGGGSWRISCEGEADCTGDTWIFHGNLGNGDNSHHNNFEWVPPPCSLSCTCSTTPRSVSHTGGGTITLQASITGGGYDEIDWDWVPGSTPCGTLREDLSDKTKAYVDFTDSDVCTGRVSAVARDGCTASCGCPDFTITNTAPTVVSVTPATGVSGTLEDDDNDSVCQDNNPRVFSVRYRDADGCSDFESARLWLDNVAPATDTRHSSVRGSVKKDGESWKVYGYRYEGGAENWDVGGQAAGVSEPADDDGMYLYFPDSAAGTTDCTSKTGGCSGSVGATQAYGVSCNENDDILTVNYKAWFYDDEMGTSLNSYGYVSDTAGASSGWVDKGDYALDFTAPEGSITGWHVEGEDAGVMRFEEKLYEDQVWDSGLRRVYNRQYHIMRSGSRLPAVEDEYYNIYDPDRVEFFGGNALWEPEASPPVGGPEAEGGFVGGDEIFPRMIGSDMACNQSVIASSSVEVGHPWIQTFGGDTYGWLGYDDLIQIQNETLSTFWLGGGSVGCGSWDFGIGIGSAQGWCSGAYNDQNRKANQGNGWYGELWRHAEKSDFALDNQGGSIVPWGTTNFSDAGDGIFVADSGVTVSGSCVGRKIVFLPDGETAEITPDFERDPTNPDEAACLIIGAEGSNIQVVPGDDQGDDEGAFDTIHVAVITDGEFEVEVDREGSRFDRLSQEGFVFSDNASFLRDLIWEDNEEYSAEEIVYDPRYMSLLRDMLGRRVYRDLECGIVKGSASCNDWLN